MYEGSSGEVCGVRRLSQFPPQVKQIVIGHEVGHSALDGLIGQRCEGKLFLADAGSSMWAQRTLRRPGRVKYVGAPDHLRRPGRSRVCGRSGWVDEPRRRAQTQIACRVDEPALSHGVP